MAFLVKGKSRKSFQLSGSKANKTEKSDLIKRMKQQKVASFRKKEKNKDQKE